MRTDTKTGPPNHPYFPKVKLINTWISRGSYRSFLSEIIRLGSSNTSAYVCFANAHMLMEAHQCQYFNHVLQKADLVCPDGRPLSLLMKAVYGIRQERACGMDLFPDILKEAAQNNLSVFFFGSTQEVLDTIISKVTQDYPALKIAGSISPPFRPLTPKEDQQITGEINASGANLVFVSLGCPKQEKWMGAHQGKINACMLGLGQAFTVYAGFEKRLPVWARNLSLEWLYRFYLEPGRLWKRYLFGNSFFLYQAGKSLLRHKLRIRI